MTCGNLADCRVIVLLAISGCFTSEFSWRGAPTAWQAFGNCLARRGLLHGYTRIEEVHGCALLSYLGFSAQRFFPYARLHLQMPDRLGVIRSSIPDVQSREHSDVLYSVAIAEAHIWPAPISLAAPTLDQRHLTPQELVV